MAVLIDTKLSADTKRELSAILASRIDDPVALRVARAVNARGSTETLVQIANGLKASFGADSLESKFMDFLISQVNDAKVAGKSDAAVLSAAQNAVSRENGCMPFTQREVGSKDFRKTNDRVAIAMFGGTGSKLVQSGKLGTLSQENFQSVQKAARGEALPERISGMDQAAWVAKYNDFILTYKDVMHESGFSPSQEMFGHMVEGQISNINKAKLTDDQKQQLVREARGRMETSYQSVGGTATKEDSNFSGGKAAKASKISKCPYRALALAMKMINQLAEMMCSSFQKTVGSSGFYKGLSTDEFNQMIGFGQRLMERGEDLEGFFGLATDKNGEPIVVPSSMIEIVMPDGRKMQVTRQAQRPADKVMESLFANIGYADVYKKLGIKADPKIKDPTQAELDRQRQLDGMDSTVVARAKDKVFRDKVKNKPQEVERAMKYVEGLGEKYKQWQKQHGHSKHESDADKNLDLGIHPSDLENALEDLEEMATNNDDAGRRAKAWLAKYKAAEERVETDGGFIPEGLQNEIIRYVDSIKNALPQLEGIKNPKAQAMTCEADTEMLFNKVEIERLRKKGLADGHEDIEYLIDRNEALRALMKQGFSGEDLNKLDVNQAATAQYIRMLSERIQNKLVDGEKLSQSELRFVEQVFGARSKEITLAGNSDIPRGTVAILESYAQDPQALVKSYSRGKEPQYQGNMSDPKPRGAQTYRRKLREMEGRLVDVFEVGGGDPENLRNHPPVGAMSGEYSELKQIIAQREREKSGGLDGSV